MSGDTKEEGIKISSDSDSEIEIDLWSDDDDEHIPKRLKVGQQNLNVEARDSQCIMGVIEVYTGDIKNCPTTPITTESLLTCLKAFYPGDNKTFDEPEQLGNIFRVLSECVPNLTNLIVCQNVSSVLTAEKESASVMCDQLRKSAKSLRSFKERQAARVCMKEAKQKISISKKALLAARKKGKSQMAGKKKEMSTAYNGKVKATKAAHQQSLTALTDTNKSQRQVSMDKLKEEYDTKVLEATAKFNANVKVIKADHEQSLSASLNALKEEYEQVVSKTADDFCAVERHQFDTSTSENQDALDIFAKLEREFDATPVVQDLKDNTSKVKKLQWLKNVLQAFATQCKLDQQEADKLRYDDVDELVNASDSDDTPDAQVFER